MRTFLRFAKRAALGLLAFIFIVVGGWSAYASLALPKSKPPLTEKFESSPARVARGEYLAKTIGACVVCHSEQDWSNYGGPVKPGTEFAGGDCLGPDQFVFNKLCIPNLTSDVETGLGGWTDGEILRAFTEGIHKSGRALHPRSGYQGFSILSDEDGKSIVVYLRTLPPVKHPTPSPDVAFWYSMAFVQAGPTPVTRPVPGPVESDPLKVGAYLFQIGDCGSCHSNPDDEDGPPSGGMEMVGPWGRVRPANLTPHETGLKNITRESFIARFKAFNDLAETPVNGGRNTVMPWLFFAGMSEADLGAIYDYLRTMKPVDHEVVRWDEPDAGSP